MLPTSKHRKLPGRRQGVAPAAAEVQATSLDCVAALIPVVYYLQGWEWRSNKHMGGPVAELANPYA
jgi:hypothetical protein